MRITKDVFMCSSSDSSSSVCALEVPPKALPMFLSPQTTITDAATRAQPATTTPTPTAHTPKKRVRWGTVTALEFSVGHNACCVPASAGPPVGLVGSPIRYTVSSVLPESAASASHSSSSGRSGAATASTATTTVTRTSSSSSTSSKSRREDFWLCPMERVRILHEEASLSLAAITEICSGVSAVLDARAFSKFDHVAHHILETLELSRREDLSKLRATYHQDNRKKIVLF